MSRYVLVFFGRGSRSADDLAVIKALPGLRIIDASSPNVVVVEARPTVKKFVNRMTDWMASEETVLPTPGPMLY